jgi:alpha-tubulin suppressor-like RCC1 family protein
MNMNIFTAKEHHGRSDADGFGATCLKVAGVNEQGQDETEIAKPALPKRRDLVWVVALPSLATVWQGHAAPGTVVAWGDDSYGQTNVPVGLTNVVAISADYRNSLALNADGSVTGWGLVASVPCGLSNVVAIAAGSYHALALKYDGTVVAWGGGTGDIYGQANVPSGLSNVVAIAAGVYHSLTACRNIQE